MFITPRNLIKTILAASVVMLCSVPAFADETSAYNCLSSASTFIVRIDPVNNMCIWSVVTGTAPGGDYQQIPGTGYRFEFSLDKDQPTTIANCSPPSLIPTSMQYDGTGLDCVFVPKGAQSRPQTVSVTADGLMGGTFQYFDGSQWNNVGSGPCPVTARECRVVPSSSKK